MKIPLSKPDITEKEKKAVLDVLETPQLSLGPKYLEFQKTAEKFAGVKFAVAVNSGTSGLHLIMRTLGIKPGDEVITTPFSFIASSNCILYEGATPVFADIDEKTWNIDVLKIEDKITPKTKAILAVDVFSRPAEWNELKRIAKKHKLFLIEDSAEALGSEYYGKKCGSFGDAGVFAFYPNKQITTGEGGMVLTNSKKIADACKSMANQGRRVENGKWLEHVRLGYNYRLNELSCALGIAQFKRIKEILQKRQKAALLYNKKLSGIEGIQVPVIGDNIKMSWFVYVIRLSGKLLPKRDIIIKRMAQMGADCSNYFQPIHLQPLYRNMFGYKPGDFPVSEKAGKSSLALPFYTAISEEEIDFVVKSFKKCIF